MSGDVGSGTSGRSTTRTPAASYDNRRTNRQSDRSFRSGHVSFITASPESKGWGATSKNREDLL